MANPKNLTRRKRDAQYTTKEKLAALILKVFNIKVEPYNLRRNYSSKYLDEVRWNVYGVNEKGMTVELMSYATMTQLVRLGIDPEPLKHDHSMWEIFPLEKPKAD